MTVRAIFCCVAMSSRRRSRSIAVPVFGEIPLNPRIAFRELRMREGPLWAQCFRYGCCGFLSLMVFLGVLVALEMTAPTYLSDDLPTATRQANLRIALLAAFVPANLVAYFLNRIFVFTPGRHGYGKEFGMFMLVSAISFLGGELGKAWIVEMGLSSLVASGAFAVSSALVNFGARKFVVFSR